MKKNYLQTIYSSQKSFNKLAYIEVENNVISLISYYTKVAYIQDDKLYLKGYYSKTTAKHIREFCQQYGYKVPTKNELDNNAVLERN